MIYILVIVLEKYLFIFQEEFLLGGPSALGIFVTTAGISERPPLQWGNNVISVAYSHPYVIVLSSDVVTVYR